MDWYKIEIPGVPIAKKRPRFARRGKFVVTYNSQETEEGRFYLDARQQWKEAPIQSPIELKAFFYMPIPKGTSKKKRELSLCGDIKHVKRADIDNLLKFSVDCLTGLVWSDDAQVWKVEMEKSYSDNPRTLLYFRRSS